MGRDRRLCSHAPAWDCGSTSSSHRLTGRGAQPSLVKPNHSAITPIVVAVRIGSATAEAAARDDEREPLRESYRKPVEAVVAAQPPVHRCSVTQLAVASSVVLGTKRSSDLP